MMRVCTLLFLALSACGGSSEDWNARLDAGQALWHEREGVDYYMGFDDRISRGYATCDNGWMRTVVQVGDDGNGTLVGRAHIRANGAGTNDPACDYVNGQVEMPTAPQEGDLLTVDAVYEECRTMLAGNGLDLPRTNIDIEDNGVLRRCEIFYAPPGTVTFSSVGIAIFSFGTISNDDARAWLADVAEDDVSAL